MWFSDMHTENVKLSIKIERQLFSAQSEYQRIDVLESREFGKILVADPASHKRSEQEWDLSIILDEARKGAAAGGPFWAIY